MVAEFTASLPAGFYRPSRSRVITFGNNTEGCQNGGENCPWHGEAVWLNDGY